MVHRHGQRLGRRRGTLRQRALKAIADTRWVPPQGENRITGMVETRPDWVVSRQRAWGVPITVFVHKDTSEVIPRSGFARSGALIDRIVAAFKTEGADAWFKPGAKQRFLEGLVDNPDDWQQVDDILDVWFDSGSTHAFVLEQRPDLKWPADLYLEGSDQHRGWFQSSLLEACGTRGRAPYDAVVTHGFVVDEDGRKMSKSLGNVVAPQDVIRQSGAEILRLWAMSSDYAEDLRIGPEIIKANVESYRKLRNTLRYLLGNLAHYQQSLAVPYAEMPELERYMLSRLAELNDAVREGYCGVRLQARLPCAAQFRRQRSLRFLFRYPQGRALLRSLRQPDAACRADRARQGVRGAHRLARPDALLHHGGGLAQSLPRG